MTLHTSFVHTNHFTIQCIHTATCYVITLILFTHIMWPHIQPPAMASYSYCSDTPFGYTHTAAFYGVTLIMFTHTIWLHTQPPVMASHIHTHSHIYIASWKSWKKRLCKCWDLNPPQTRKISLHRSITEDIWGYISILRSIPSVPHRLFSLIVESVMCWTPGLVPIKKKTYQ